jgi:hypothetical protein
MFKSKIIKGMLENAKNKTNTNIFNDYIYWKKDMVDTKKLHYKFSLQV